MESGWDFGTINNLIQDALWASALAIWIWRKVQAKKPGVPAMSSASKLVGIALIAGLIVSSVSLYFNFQPRVTEKTVTVTEPYKYKWLGDTPPSSLVSDRFFDDEEVPLDGKSYINCTFTNVTFVYDGTAPMVFSHNSVFGGFKIKSNNPSVEASLIFLYGFGVLKIPIVKSGTHTPLEHIEPPSYSKPHS
jgi:hypothetical protein